jgi:4-hydroxy-tetrahydrodipicolinate synthase
VDISLDILSRLAKVPNIVAVKQATDSIVNISELCQRTSNYWTILSGDDSSTLYLMLVGGKGVISATASALPKEMTDLVRACEASDWTKASYLQISLMEKFKALFMETNPTPAKAVLVMKGVIKTDLVRLPLVEVTEETRAYLKKVFI